MPAAIGIRQDRIAVPNDTKMHVNNSYVLLSPRLTVDDTCSLSDRASYLVAALEDLGEDLRHLRQKHAEGHQQCDQEKAPTAMATDAANVTTRHTFHHQLCFSQRLVGPDLKPQGQVERKKA